MVTRVFAHCCILPLFLLSSCILIQPNPIPCPAATLPPTAIQLTHSTAQEPDASTIMAQSQVFLIDQKMYNTEGIGTIAETEVLTGLIRLAIGRPVEDPIEPGPPPLDEPTEWVVFVPAGSDTDINFWEVTVLTKTQGTELQQQALSFPIQTVVTFTQQATTEASLSALLDAQSQWSADHNDQFLWTDVLVLEAAIDTQQSSFRAHFFTSYSDFPDPPDRKVFFCSRVYRCQSPGTIRERIACWWHCS